MCYRIALLLLAAAVASSAAPVSADEIMLKSGAVMYGQILEESATDIVIEVWPNDQPAANPDHHYRVTLPKRKVQYFKRTGSRTAIKPQVKAEAPRAEEAPRTEKKEAPAAFIGRRPPLPKKEAAVAPPGPPWVRNFLEARELALRKNRPILLYATKPG